MMSKLRSRIEKEYSARHLSPGNLAPLKEQLGDQLKALRAVNLGNPAGSPAKPSKEVLNFIVRGGHS